MDIRTDECLSSLRARLLTAKRTKAETLGVPTYVLRQAADAIERLQEERDEAVIGTAELTGILRNLGDRFDRLAEYRAKAERDLRTVEKERDAALAEAEDTIERLQKRNERLSKHNKLLVEVRPVEGK